LSAAIPQTISYQGKLTTPDGIGINDTLEMKFLLFDSESSADSIWGETQPNVPVVHGLFDVELGAVNPIDLPFDTTYWLLIVVEGTELIPRINLTSSPYAYRAAIADSLTAEMSVVCPGNGVALTISASPDSTGDFVCGSSSAQIQINAAIDSLASLGGGELYIKSGDYRTNGAVVVSGDNIAIRGAGRATKIFSDFAIDVHIIHVEGIPGDNRRGITISNLFVSSTSSTGCGGSGIYFKYVEKSVIDRCWAEDCNEDAILLHSSSDNTILNCRVDGNYARGIRLFESPGNALIGNTVNGNGGSGIYIENSDRNIVNSNTCRDNYNNGILLIDSQNNVFNGNYIEANGTHGFYIYQSMYNSITGNMVYNNSNRTYQFYNGLHLAYECDRNVITGNQIIGAGQKYGINIDDDTCTENIIQNNELYWNDVPYRDNGTDTNDWGPGFPPSSSNIDDGGNYW